MAGFFVPGAKYRMGVKFTSKQIEARKLAQSRARFILFRGGSRSGKTFAVVCMLITRALLTPNSRHGLFRQFRADAEATLWNLTLRDAMEKLHPGLWEVLSKQRKINESEMTIEFPNGSIIVVKGLDDSTKQERILGDEFATIAVDEVSQFKSFEIFQKLIGRLSQEKEVFLDDKPTGKVLRPKMFLMCNPPASKRHWTFEVFMNKINPLSQEPFPRPEDWAQLQMNPIDNQENISSSYIDDLNNLSAADRKRFLDGEWGSDNENGMFKSHWWAGDGPYRRHPKEAPGDHEYERIVVMVDPASSNTVNSDEAGIIVAGCREGHAYILEDASGKMGPHAWGKKAIELREKWDADYIMAERDGGADYVKMTILNIDPFAPFQETKSGGLSKPARALPVANAYEAGKVHHCGSFDKLEDQMVEFHLDWSRTRHGSPDRLDALVYAVKELLMIEQEKRGGSQGGFSPFS